MLSQRIFVALIAAFSCWSLSAFARPAALQDVDALFKRQNDNQWFKDGNGFIRSSVQRKVINRKAKNVILFIGDGMGISTVTAARVLDGQLRSQTGEENVLSWEKFPHVALSKTYNTDAQTPDSAGTATAIMTGVKAREGVISVNEDVMRKNCTSSQGNEVLSILELAEKKGMASGVVSTARLTHATPSTTYAHSADRDWEYEADGGCPDIASQLLSFQFGDGIEVALGGGRRGFIPTSMSDPEYPDKKGMRKDNRDLTKEWTDKSSPGNKWEYVWKKEQFQKLNPKETSHVLGLFDYSHMQYASETAKDTGGEPTLSEMTEFAIKALQAKEKGFFLLVEGGRIDHGHHDNLGYKALHDAVEMAKAVGKADELTNKEDTLIIVTADHSHVFVFGGYQKRGNPIFGLTGNSGKAQDGKSFTSIGYYNGPGAKVNAVREEPVGYDKPEYAQQSLVPLESETHGAEDVGIYARGPQAHLFQGVVEQSNIFHVMDYALCLSDTKMEVCRQQGISGQSRLALSPLMLIMTISFVCLQGY